MYNNILNTNSYNTVGQFLSRTRARAQPDPNPNLTLTFNPNEIAGQTRVSVRFRMKRLAARTATTGDGVLRVCAQGGFARVGLQTDETNVMKALPKTCFTPMYHTTLYCKLVTPFSPFISRASARTQPNLNPTRNLTLPLSLPPNHTPWGSRPRQARAVPNAEFVVGI